MQKLIFTMYVHCYITSSVSYSSSAFNVYIIFSHNADCSVFSSWVNTFYYSIDRFWLIISREVRCFVTRISSACLGKDFQVMLYTSCPTGSAPPMYFLQFNRQAVLYRVCEASQTIRGKKKGMCVKVELHRWRGRVSFTTHTHTHTHSSEVLRSCISKPLVLTRLCTHTHTHTHTHTLTHSRQKCWDHVYQSVWSWHVCAHTHTHTHTHIHTLVRSAEIMYIKASGLDTSVHTHTHTHTHTYTHSSEVLRSCISKRLVLTRLCTHTHTHTHLRASLALIWHLVWFLWSAAVLPVTERSHSRTFNITHICLTH